MKSRAPAATPLMWKTGHSPDQGEDGGDRLPARRRDVRPYFLRRSLVRFRRCAVCGGSHCLGIVARMDGKLSEVREALPQVINTPEVRFDCDDRRKFAVIEEVAARLRRESANVSEIDGVRVLTADGWWLLRASNTQAVLVARAEATTASGPGAAEGRAGEAAWRHRVWRSRIFPAAMPGTKLRSCSETTASSCHSRESGNLPPPAGFPLSRE